MEHKLDHMSIRKGLPEKESSKVRCERKRWIEILGAQE